MRFNTKLLHGKSISKNANGDILPPISQVSAFQYDSMEELEKVFQHKKMGFAYTRIGNPTIGAGGLGAPAAMYLAAAGVDAEDGSRVIEKVYILTNTDHTNEHFTIDPKEQLQAIKDMRANGLKPLGNWHSHAKQFNVDNFDIEVLESDIPVLVDFYADWCGPCKMMSPVIDKLAVEFEGKVKLGKCNVDDNMSIAQEYGVSSIPNMKIFKGGEVVDSVIGTTSESVLREKLENL